ncbi:sodium:proton antiporter [Eleftheria terrae]|uniref:sodium:proton antiporter n=1 Tax=Eleftheria terrae TaxID=1597781 RepID=UPI00263AC928|nr:sodium:proton antiporter [Eleftheria terrae]WKB53378.1 sodium:proton antiporter [Eleftheria terrae]
MTHRLPRLRALAAFALLLLPGLAQASAVDASAMSALWALPFAGLLLSIALMPLLLPQFWHHHYGKVTAGWALAFLLPYAARFGADAAGASLAHALLADYLPFIILLTALFTVAGGIFLRGNLHGSPQLNTGLMLAGALLASLMGTTGASMLLVRPLIRANDNRPHAAHVMVFFIFIVSNVGGALTPLGDPPLFLGFLKGVDFSWTAVHLPPHTAFMLAALLALFYLVDRHYFSKEDALPNDPTPDSQGFGIEGAVNLLLLLVVVGLVLLSGLWKTQVAFELFGLSLGLPQLVRDGGLLLVIGLSLALTPRAAREQNQFTWGPMLEVSRLFAGIFLTIIPVLALLKAGLHGPFAPVVQLVTGEAGQPVVSMYFWAAGLLSSFLDNAPTYLVFFNLAGGDAQQLMTGLAPVLVAISAGSVFMGANSYIGNAPNLMVKAIAEDRGIRMPGFFGYMAWSAAVLLPLFGLLTLLFFVR